MKQYRKDYKCTVKLRRLDKHNNYKHYYEQKYSTITLEKVVVIINSDIYDKVYSEMKNNDLFACFGTEEVNELLTEKVESDIIKGKEKIELEITEQTFRTLIFDTAFQLVKHDKYYSSRKITNKKTNSKLLNNFDFDIPNSFAHLDFNKKVS